jgi:hypothetical protein
MRAVARLLLGTVALALAVTDAFGADLLGTVTKAGKVQPAQGVQLEPKPRDGKAPRTAKTDAAGNYLFQDVRPGDYFLTCNGKSREVTVRPGAQRADCKD